MLYKWMKKLHMYAGLLSFTAFMVWGIAGVGATFRPGPGNRTPQEPEVRYLDFQADPNATDQQVTDAMIERSGLPFIQPGRKPARDPEGRLWVRYFHPNGQRRIILLEDEGKLRIEQIDSSLWQFLNVLHMQSWLHSNPGFEVRLWGLYNEFSLWAVIFMTLSGLYMWLATRPGMQWAQWTFGLSTAAFVVLYVALR